MIFNGIIQKLLQIGKMKNHYIKLKSSSTLKINNELESIIYDCLIEDELISDEKLHSLISIRIKKEHGSLIYSNVEIQDTIKNLSDRKIIKEVFGQKLYKFVNA